MTRDRTRDHANDDAPKWVTEQNVKACSTCGEQFEFWTSLTLSDDGRRRCATCHITYLKRFTSKPTDRCTEPDCTLTVAEHIAEFRRLGRIIEQRIITPSEAEIIHL